MGEQQRNRWLILLASIICNLSIGSAYAWSVFQKPLLSIFSWTPSEASMAFTLSLAVMPVAMIIAGRIQDRQGPKVVMMVGGAMYGIGVFATGFTSSLTFFVPDVWGFRRPGYWYGICLCHCQHGEVVSR